MKTDKDMLRKFFAQKAPWNRSAPGALDVLEPFFGKAEADRYDLIYGPRLNVSDVCAALWTATGADAKGCVFVPTCVPVLDPPPWASDVAWQRHPDERTLPYLLFQRLSAARAEARMADDAEKLQIVFEASLGEALRSTIMRTLADSQTVHRQAWETVRYALSAYVVLALTGHPQANDLVPLLRVLDQAIPIAPLPHRPRIWCVLTG